MKSNKRKVIIESIYNLHTKEYEEEKCHIVVSYESAVNLMVQGFDLKITEYKKKKKIKKILEAIKNFLDYETPYDFYFFS